MRQGETGERVWHFQLTHHDLWTSIRRLSILADITVDGRPIKAVVQVTSRPLPTSSIASREAVWRSKNAVRNPRRPGADSPTQPFRQARRSIVRDRRSTT